jgi:hypothetical protein
VGVLAIGAETEDDGESALRRLEALSGEPDGGVSDGDEDAGAFFEDARGRLEEARAGADM